MIQQDPIPLEERVSQLEEEMNRLKSRFPPTREGLGWLSHFEGILEDDNLTDQATRLGREWREIQQDGPSAP